jgi:hypothetical protein
MGPLRHPASDSLLTPMAISHLVIASHVLRSSQLQGETPRVEVFTYRTINLSDNETILYDTDTACNII